MFLEISGNMFIVIVVYSVCEVINFEIYLFPNDHKVDNLNFFAGVFQSIITAIMKINLLPDCQNIFHGIAVV